MPTAVIAADDFGAAALLQVSRQMGLRVPGDMSVVGFSDILLCHTWYPPLTTVRQPKEDLGREAFRLLRQLIEGEHLDVGDAVRLLPTELIVRESCGPVGVKAGRPRKTRRS
jgi:DNA-binding LacI/PurR family transcriptional regulator